jgi:hypothetical protein
MRRISPFEESKGEYLKVFVLDSMVMIGFEMRQDETRSNSWRKLRFSHESQDEVVATLWRSETSLSHICTQHPADQSLLEEGMTFQRRAIRKWQNVLA